MALQLHRHHGPPMNAATRSGRLRGLAGVIAHGFATPPAVVPPAVAAPEPGRVVSGGVWSDAGVHTALARVLGPRLAPALRPTLEWFVCRGAFFHNDAHYDDVLFGVWCLEGPPADLVFPRVGIRIDASPGHASVFDPFEVHGVLRPDRSAYAAEDYAGGAASLFIGFELDMSPSARELFRLSAPSGERAFSSRTRIAATTGAFE